MNKKYVVTLTDEERRSLWALARYVQVTGDQEFLAPAIEKMQMGVLPGQLPTGRWMDPHNARTSYHSIMLRAIAKLYGALPEDHPFRSELRVAIERAEPVLVEELRNHGVISGDHSISALCAVERVLGPHPKRSEAIRVIINAVYAQLVDPRKKCMKGLTFFGVRQVIERHGPRAPKEMQPTKW